MRRFRFSESVFAVLLRAYPRRFRESFASELQAFFREERQRAERAGGGAVARMWARTVADLLQSAWRQRTARATRGSHDREPGLPRKDRRMFETLQDVRYAVRSFARAPGFVAVVVLTLALGVGATTGVLGIVDGVLLRPLPYPDSDRLVYIGTRFDRSPDELTVMSEGNLLDLKQQAATLVAIAGSSDISFTMLGNGDPQLVDGAGVGFEFFPMLGVQPALGRVFGEADFEPGARKVALLGHAFWRDRWGADAGAIGRTLTLNREPYTIIGVLPADFRPPEALFGQKEARLWVPLRIPVPPRRSAMRYQALGRLAPGATIESAAFEIDRIFRAQTPLHGLTFEVGGGAESLRERTLGTSSEPLLLLLSAVACLLLIASANVANLMLARGTRRSHEIAVRRSLGAGRWRLVRQLLTESILLAVAGGLVGVLLAWGAVEAFKAAGPGGIPRISEVAVDVRVLLAALFLSTAVGLLFGLAPVAQAMGGDGAARIRAVAGPGRGASSAGRSRSFLVVIETALALVLLIGAGLLVNSFVRLSRVDPGVDSAGLMTMRVSLRSAYPDREAWSPLFQELLEGVRSIPGVTSASLTTSLPFAGIGVMSQVVALDSPVAEGAEFIASTYISGGHFQNMGMSLLQGGDFERGSEEGPLQVIVNEAFARRYWPETNSVVGRRVRMGEAADDPVATVVGMVGSLRYRHDQSEAEELYFDMDTQPWQSMWVIARTGRGPSSVAPSLRQALWRIDPDLPIDRIASLDELAWNSIGQPRFYSGLAASLAAIALILALVGLYGTMAYSVSARVRELGIRMALGASPAGVVALVLRGGARLVALGVVAGTGVAWVVSRLLERFLFGVVATDLATFVVVAALFIGTASIACWLPARRAASLDPVNALRCDD